MLNGEKLAKPAPHRYLRDVRVPCPHCGAVPGEPCREVARDRVHVTRRVYAIVSAMPLSTWGR